jgi:hypothetical protein
MDVGDVANISNVQVPFVKCEYEKYDIICDQLV